MLGAGARPSDLQASATRGVPFRAFADAGWSGSTMDGTGWVKRGRIIAVFALAAGCAAGSGGASPSHAAGAAVPGTPPVLEAGETTRLLQKSPLSLDTAEEAASAAVAPATEPAAVLSRAPKPGSGEVITPVKVKTITVKAGNVQTAMLVPLVSPAPQASVAPPSFAPSAALPPPPGARPGVLGVLPVEPSPSQPGTYQMASAASVPVQLAPASTQPARKIDPRRPWMIQVGAFPKEDEAKERLREAQSVGKTVVAKAEPFTERVTKGATELYRARFAGFDQDAAEAACKYFKRNEIACMATRN